MEEEDGQTTFCVEGRVSDGEPSRGLGRCLTKPRSIQGQEGNCLKGRVQGDQSGSGT